MTKSGLWEATLEYWTGRKWPSEEVVIEIGGWTRRSDESKVERDHSARELGELEEGRRALEAMDARVCKSAKLFRQPNDEGG